VMPGEPATPVAMTVPHGPQRTFDGVADPTTLTPTRRALLRLRPGTHAGQGSRRHDVPTWCTAAPDVRSDAAPIGSRGWPRLVS
jgi:hypothetical protein